MVTKMPAFHFAWRTFFLHSKLVKLDMIKRNEQKSQRNELNVS